MLKLGMDDEKRSFIERLLAEAKRELALATASKKTAIAAGIRTDPRHTFRATGITACLADGGTLENARGNGGTRKPADDETLRPYEGAAYLGRGQTDQVVSPGRYRPRLTAAKILLGSALHIKVLIGGGAPPIQPTLARPTSGRGQDCFRPTSRPAGSSPRFRPLRPGRRFRPRLRAGHCRHSR